MPGAIAFEDFRNHRNLVRWILIAWLVFSAAGLPKIHGAESSLLPAEDERWYVLKMGENTVGYLHELVRRLSPNSASEREAILKTDSEMRLALNRVGSRVEIRFSASTEETTDGSLVRTRYEMLASSQAIRAEAEIGEGKIDLKTEAGGKAYTTTLSYSGTLLGPEGIRRMSAAYLKKPGDRVAVQTFVAEASIVGTISRLLLGNEVIALGEKKVDVSKVEEVLEGMPIKRTVWLDREGCLVKQEEPGPFGQMTIQLSDKSSALAAAGGADLPKDMYRNSIARTNVRLPRASPVERLRLRLIHNNPSLGWPDLSTPNQTMIEKNEKEMILEITRPKPTVRAEFPVAATEENEEYLSPNAYVQSDDPEVQKLVRGLLQGEKDILRASQILRQWVAENMTFDLGIVFAPSSEIFRDRRGTCVGYATMLATLARAAGIPSRVVMGYVYALGMFGGHAWTEVLAGDQWIPLDAAVVNEGVADATRFYFVASSLADGPGDLSFGAAQQMFGQITIEIMEFETAGRTVVVPRDAKPYAVESDSYRNPWLGISFRRPDGFKFAELDAVWPDPTIVRLEDPGGTSAVLSQDQILPWQDAENAIRARLGQYAAREGIEKAKTGAGIEFYKADSPAGNRSAAAFLRGSEILIWKVEGSDASRLLRLILESFRCDGNFSSPQDGS